MKASLKFRNDQKPIFRAKVPINILGFPFQSGIVAGESKELSLNLSTFFDTGPSFKFAYRPNDSLNPFSLIFKTGIGHFGSPISSPMNMSAEFNFVGGQNPSFFINFKPKFGDFALKKTQTSVFKKELKANGVVSDDDGSVMVENPVVVNDGYKRFTVLPLESPAAGVVKGVCEDIEVSATTAVPLRKHAKLNFRWGVRFPADMTAAGRGNPTAGILFEKLPMLVMNKIGIEHVARDDSKDSNSVGPRFKGADAVGACLDVSKQLEVIQAENEMLRKAMEDFRSDFLGVGSGKAGALRDFERGERKSSGGGRIDKKSRESNGFGGKAMEGEVNEEMKKGLKGTAGA